MDGIKQGFIPANHIRVLGKRKGTRQAVKNEREAIATIPGTETWAGARPKTSLHEAQHQMSDAQPACSSNLHSSGESAVSNVPCDQQSGNHMLEGEEPQI